MANNYEFIEGNTNSTKVREAIEVGTDGNGNSILRNVVEVEPGSNPLDVSAATVTVADNGAFDINSLPNVTIGSQSAGLAQESSLSTIANTIVSEDTAHSSGDSSVPIVAVRNDTLASLVDTDGDYSPLQVDQDGALYATIKGSLGTVEGDVADDTADSGNPVKIGAYASSSEPAAVNDGDRVNALADLHGRIRVLDENQMQAANNSVEVVSETDEVFAGGSVSTVQNAFIDVATSGENTLVASVSSTKIRVLSLTVTTDTAHKVSFLDGTGGSALHAIYAAANSGAVEDASQGYLFETSAGNALIANLGGANNTAIRATYVEV